VISTARLAAAVALHSTAMYLAKYSIWVMALSIAPRAVFQALFFVLVVQFAVGGERLGFVLAGNAVAIGAAAALLGIGNIIVEERKLGTLSYLMATPSRVAVVLAARATPFLFEAVLTAVLVLVCVGTAIDQAPPMDRILAASPAILVTSVSAGGLGLLLAAAALETRFFTPIGNAAFYVLVVLCGINYPTSALPSEFQWLANALPITHGATAVRAIVDGAPAADIIPSVLIEAGIGAANWLAAFTIFGIQARRARVIGRLDQF
jgi:ABC-2 type transport system permease protein